MRAATQHRPRWIAGLLAATCVLNVIDVVATLAFVSSGVAVEANPIMARALALGPAAFVAIKIAVVTLGALVLWRYARLGLAKLGSVVVCAAYALVVIYDLGWMRALGT